MGSYGITKRVREFLLSVPSARITVAVFDSKRLAFCVLSASVLGLVHVMPHVDKTVCHSKDTSLLLAMVLAAIDELGPGELIAVADTLASKRDQTSSNTVAAGASAGVVPLEDVETGSTGSQPIQSPRVLAHVGKVEKTWAYDGADSLQMLDEAAIRILNAHDGNEQSLLERFTFTRRLKNDETIEYEVDTHAMTSTNKESKKKRAVHRMQLRVLGVKYMLGACSTASFSELTNDAWTMQWQFKDDSGWKNMTQESNQILLDAFLAQNSNVAIIHDWQDPWHWKRTYYDVDLLWERQTKRGSHRTKRPVRLVAFREWCLN